MNAPGDAFEQEADRVADRVMRMPEPGGDTSSSAHVGLGTGMPTMQRACAACSGAVSSPHEADEMMQAKEVPGSVPRVSAETAGAIDSLRGGGQSLSVSERRFFEPRFGHDFSNVRLHTDARAAGTAHAVNAKAYTIGNDVVFGEGYFAPGTDAGRRLLAHELTHVVQQTGGRVARTIQRAETDTGAPAINCPTLPDGSAALNAQVNSILGAVRALLPAPIVPADMVFRAFERLGGAAGPFLAHIELWANTNLPHRGGGMGFGVIAGTKYRSLPLTQRALYTYLAPVVKLHGTCVGTDKIGHMFQQGFQYFLVANRGTTSVGGTLGMGRGDAYARAWGEWMEGVLSPATRANAAIMAWLRSLAALSVASTGLTGRAQGHFGLATTGVHSRADLESNNAGLRFYQELFRNPNLSFDINRYVSANWNEEVAGNIYSNVVGSAVRSAGRLNPADVVLPP